MQEETMLGTAGTSIDIRTLALAMGCSAFLAFSLPAHAAGGGGGGGGGNAGETTMKTCPKGQIWNRKKHRCIRATSEVLPDDNLTDYAYALAKAKRFPEALDVLNMLKDPNTAEALNYRGYITRHLGRLDEGIGYYLKSVSIDPHYAQVREYLGEAYVLKGRDDLAHNQLAAIKAICGTQCEEYKDLAEAIADPSKI
jgi:tetratricopeptide (TPR) repeat protein